MVLREFIISGICRRLQMDWNMSFNSGPKKVSTACLGTLCSKTWTIDFKHEEVHMSSYTVVLKRRYSDSLHPFCHSDCCFSSLHLWAVDNIKTCNKLLSTARQFNNRLADDYKVPSAYWQDTPILQSKDSLYFVFWNCIQSEPERRALTSTWKLLLEQEKLSSILVRVVKAFSPEGIVS